MAVLEDTAAWQLRDAAGNEEGAWTRAFSQVMRSTPEVVIVKGTLRHPYQANFIGQALETGHTVVCAVHHSSLVSALHRLVDLGLPVDTLHRTLRGAVHQRPCRWPGPTPLMVSACAFPASAAQAEALCNNQLPHRTLIADAVHLVQAGCMTEQMIGAMLGQDALLALEKARTSQKRQSLHGQD